MKRKKMKRLRWQWQDEFNKHVEEAINRLGDVDFSGLPFRSENAGFVTPRSWAETGEALAKATYPCLNTMMKDDDNMPDPIPRRQDELAWAIVILKRVRDRLYDGAALSYDQRRDLAAQLDHVLDNIN